MSHLECQTDEARMGLEIFFTDTPGILGRLKFLPEDFVVDEISEHPPPAEEGRYTIATVTSTNWEMNRLVRQLSRALRISRNRIGFAGTKDKRAVTTQLMSFELLPEALEPTPLTDVVISSPYRSRRKIQIGDLVGNSFRIRIRECAFSGDELHEIASRTRTELEELGGFPNFFGVQRFGITRPITHIVGKHIVKGDMEAAVLAYVAEPSIYEDEEVREARRHVGETGDFASVQSSFPRTLTFERIVAEHIASHPGDFAGAIMALPTNLQMMFVHAYQSYMFNRMLSERIRQDLPLDRPLVGDLVLPLDTNGTPLHERAIRVTATNIDLVEKQVRNRKAFVSGVLFGSGSEFAEGEMGEIERKIVEQEGLEGKDFVVPEIQQCSSKGSRRELLAPFSDMGMEVDGDSLTISFSLTKGNYATTLLREFMKAEVTSY
jgi:tRNA pseudouridine13 synthase